MKYVGGPRHGLDVEPFFERRCVEEITVMAAPQEGKPTTGDDFGFPVERHIYKRRWLVVEPNHARVFMCDSSLTDGEILQRSTAFGILKQVEL